MQERYEKPIWAVGFGVMLLLALDIKLMIPLAMILSIFAGAYARGKNWCIGWKRVCVSEDRIK